MTDPANFSAVSGATESGTGRGFSSMGSSGGLPPDVSSFNLLINSSISGASSGDDQGRSSNASSGSGNSFRSFFTSDTPFGPRSPATVPSGGGVPPEMPGGGSFAFSRGGRQDAQEQKSFLSQPASQRSQLKRYRSPTERPEVSAWNGTTSHGPHSSIVPNELPSSSNGQALTALVPSTSFPTDDTLTSGHVPRSPTAPLQFSQCPPEASHQPALQQSTEFPSLLTPQQRKQLYNMQQQRLFGNGQFHVDQARLFPSTQQALQANGLQVAHDRAQSDAYKQQQTGVRHLQPLSDSHRNGGTPGGLSTERGGNTPSQGSVSSLDGYGHASPSQKELWEAQQRLAAERSWQAWQEHGVPSRGPSGVVPGRMESSTWVGSRGTPPISGQSSPLNAIPAPDDWVSGPGYHSLGSHSPASVGARPAGQSNGRGIPPGRRGSSSKSRGRNESPLASILGSGGAMIAGAAGVLFAGALAFMALNGQTECRTGQCSSDKKDLLQDKEEDDFPVVLHKVAPGETICSIASCYGADADVVIDLNMVDPMTHRIRDPDVIFPGEVVIVPSPRSPAGKTVFN